MLLVEQGAHAAGLPSAKWPYWWVRAAPPAGPCWWLEAAAVQARLCWWLHAAAALARAQHVQRWLR